MLHPEEDHIEKAAIYGAFACGVNVYLASHTDAVICIQQHLCIKGDNTLVRIKFFVILLFQDLGLQYLFVRVMYCSSIQKNLTV
jgi:hypothetical protein